MDDIFISDVFECLPCPKDQLFYNGRGDIQMENVKTLLHDKHKVVILYIHVLYFLVNTKCIQVILSTCFFNLIAVFS